MTNLTRIETSYGVVYTEGAISANGEYRLGENESIYYLNLHVSEGEKSLGDATYNHRNMDGAVSININCRDDKDRAKITSTMDAVLAEIQAQMKA